MATMLPQIWENFCWRLEAITPTSNISSQVFRRYNKADIKPDDCAGLERSFTVTWLSGSRDLGATDQSERDSAHEFMVQIVYWPGRGWQECHQLILSDQWDVTKALRDDRLYVGWDASNAADDLNLIERALSSQELDFADEDVWILRQTWTCHVREIS